MAITAAPPTAPSAASRSGRQTRRNTLIGVSFILPNFLGFALLTLVPVVRALDGAVGAVGGAAVMAMVLLRLAARAGSTPARARGS